ncbi:MAG TPA: deoxyribonuclease IV, partial [Planctomycetota bacterium]|nr:deoxyribonuclease IV [Planctomycetota bacterium]
LDETSDVRVRLLIEITAGQGSSLGSRFEEVRDLIALVDGGARVGTCFDTCHAHAAGYDLSKPESAKAAFDEFDRVVGSRTLGLFHLNDAKKPVGCRVDRHEHIGKGTIGLAGFRVLAKDSRFRSVPKVIETEKSVDGDGLAFDRMNLATLKRAGF